MNPATPGIDWRARRARVDEPHVSPLSTLVRVWRSPAGAPTRFLPWFDPDSAGVDARVLVLMQSPGPSTVAAGDLAFSSEDNPGPTAAAFRRARVESGLERSAYLRWNIVPWAHEGPVGVGDLEAARPALDQLIRTLPRLRAVVTVGTPALTGVMRWLTLSCDVPVRPVLAVPHLSPANAVRRGETLTRAVTALRHAADLASG